ncbi:selenocysteine-specific translation elongation factor [Actinopolymorpha sp. B9G3]|uniref:selenocysteine-specific translation elongation factor n=1 Tax=Actinopolymorpha sp. B9G3 TaxID=3158970 RepID=UPI0032D8D980
MYVVATAGHVDHGKSTLVRRLTGMEPDRWAEERRRGLTIDLGFAWMTLPDGGELAFVDVPGHERFVSNMLAGVGPAPACVFVVAADEGWQPQSAEHLAALDALGVRHGLLVVTRSDLADPEPARVEALARLAETTLGRVPSVTVSGETGAGMDGLERALVELTERLPCADPDADVRLWVDRVFSVRGAGTVVTGTLGAGTLRVGDELELASADPDRGRDRARVRARVRLRGLQALGRDSTRVAAAARVAVNLRGVERSEVGRGAALLTPESWLATEVVDVTLRYADGGERSDPSGPGAIAERLVLHVGSAAVPVRVRAFDATTARLSLARPLPLRTGDRALLRDPGRKRVVAGVVVLEVRPPELRRRGAARTRAADLAGAIGPASAASAAGAASGPGAASAASAAGAAGAASAAARAAGVPALRFDQLAALVLRDGGIVRGQEFLVRGLPAPTGATTPAQDWYADESHWARLVRQATDVLVTWTAANPLAAGMPADALRQRLDLSPTLPSDLFQALVAAAGLDLRDGVVRRPGDDDGPVLPPHLEKAVRAIEEDLGAAPFASPDAHRLSALGMGTREIAAAVRAGRLLRIADGVVLLPDADDQARAILAELPQPFTLSQARIALGTTRRVAVPLLELLDANGITERLADGTHRLR